MCFLGLHALSQNGSDIFPAQKRGGDQVPKTSAEWTFGLLGNDIGGQGSFAEDMTGNGFKDLVLANSAYWYILENDDGFEPKIKFISEAQLFDLDRDIRRVLSFSQVTGVPTVAVAYEDSTIDLFEPPCRNALETIDLSLHLNGITTMALANVDLDPELEMVISDGTDLFIFSATAPYTLEKKIDDLGGSSLVVGQVDNDPELEIVIDKNDRGYVVDATGQIEWDFGAQFGDYLDLGDVDQDGRQEIVGAIGGNLSIFDSKVSVYDADTQTLKWEIILNFDADSLLVGDVDGDNVPEVLFSDRSPSLIFCHQGDGTLMWSVPNTESGVSAMVLMDIDNNGVNELFFGSGNLSTGPDFFQMVDTTTQTVRWRSDSLDGGFSNVRVGDLDNNGTDEIVMCTRSTQTGRGGGILHVFNGKTRDLLFKGLVDSAEVTRDIHAIEIANIDADPQKEIILISEATLIIIDGLTFEFEHFLRDLSWRFGPLFVSDVDLDGDVEILIGNNDFNDKQIWIFDGATATLEWQSPNFPVGGAFRIEVADMDQDGNPDIVAGTPLAIDIIDGVTKQLKQRIPISDPTAMTLGNIDNDPAIEILIANFSGQVFAIDGQTYVEEFRQGVRPGTPIFLLRYLNLRGNSQPEWIVGAGNDVFVYKDILQPPVWRNGFAGSGWGFGNQAAVGNFVDDGLGELFIGTDHALVEFEPRALCDPLTIQEMQQDWPLPALDIRQLMAAQFCIETCP